MTPTEVILTTVQYDPLLAGMVGMAFSLKVIMTSLVILIFIQTFDMTRKGVQSWRRG